MLDLESVTEKDLLSLGFQYWTLSNGEKILLVPKSVYDFIPDGSILTEIGGSRKEKGVDYIDMDTRLGMLAYGLGKDFFRNLKINDVLSD